VRAALNHLGIKGGIEVTTVADIPSRGTGLGSSSSFTVALLHALQAHIGRHATNEQLAADTCHIEIDVCGAPIGKQDQYAAAYGGFNLIEFHQDDSVKVSPVICPPETLTALQARMLVFYTGITRSASGVLQAQTQSVSSDEAKRTTLRKMVSLTYQLRDELQRGNVQAVGEILHENWELKKTLAGSISTSDIDSWYERARQAGALGGKLLGAGGGGFMLFDAPAERHEAIAHAIPSSGVSSSASSGSVVRSSFIAQLFDP
jgi:D-glycero-alpha-D-manno-heptose-7-phosphate kinase